MSERQYIMKPTIRLFDISSRTAIFEAIVISCEERECGYEVVLDRTAFFPEEGGQSSDTGSLGNASVSHVFEKEGIIYHVTDRPLQKGMAVSGKICFEARFRKMQNHTGEHIVSGLIHKNFGFNNVGFHLGVDDMTADFDGELSESDIRLIEDLANRAVFECHPIKAYYPTPEELKTLEYRSKLDLCEGVRIVDIEGVDKCACCAPHVENTGEVGLIKITEFIRYKGGMRIHMRCGYDALDAFRSDYAQVKAISMAISAKHYEVVPGVDRLIDEMGKQKSVISSLKREIRGYKLEKLEYTDKNLVLFEDEGDMLTMRELVNGAKAKCGRICAAFAGNDTDGYKYIISSASVDLKPLTKEINAAISGRGGGSSEMIQGSCTAKREKIEEYFK